MRTVGIVGAGPAGLFAAKELAASGYRVFIVEKRSTLGGLGLNSDGKLNFHPKIGGNLTDYVTPEVAWRIVRKIEEDFYRYGAERAFFDEDGTKELVKRAIRAGIRFIPIRQTHIGSDYLPKVIEGLRRELKDLGVKLYLNTKALDFEVEGGRVVSLATSRGEIKLDYLVLAPGRGGFEWIESLIRRHSLRFSYTPIDIGVRVEVPNEVFDEIVNVYHVWDPKFHVRTKKYDDFARTFCTNPSGFVVKEYYGNSIFGVNGHALKRRKSENTNFALLVRVNLTKPLENTTLYGKRIAQLANTLGGGKPLIQRMGDLEGGRRSTWERIKRSFVEPTLKDVTPGDISMAYPSRIVTDIVESLAALDRVLPGIAADSTLLYAPEIKFYALRIRTDKRLRSLDIENLYIAGDGVGVSRGIVGAAATGIIAAWGIMGK